MDNKPTQLEFNSALSAVQAAAAQYSADCDTHKGSVVYQLLLRPLSYIYAKLYAFICGFAASISLSNFRTSSATDTEQLDAIASNFMIKRKTSTAAQGFITVILEQPTLFLSDTLQVYIQQYTFVLRNRILIVPATQTDVSVSSDTEIVRAYAITENQYQAQVPVVCTQPGHIALSEYSSVQHNWNLTGVVDIKLLAPIVGGTDVQSDMQLVSRIQDVALYAAQDIPRALQKRLEVAPYPVASLYAVGGQQNTRSFYNTAQISSGGTVDVYIKTQQQIQTVQTAAIANYGPDGNTYIELMPNQAAGCYKIVQIRAVSGTPVLVSEVRFRTSLPQIMSDDSAMLSAYQYIQIYSSEFTAGDTYTVVLSRMPGILDNQRYIEAPETRFVGQSVLLHAALPVDIGLRIGLSCAGGQMPQLMAQMRQFIAGLICDIEVGRSILNMSDIDAAFIKAYPGCRLKAPCTIRCAIPTKDNDVYTFTSQAFYIDIKQRLGIYTWPSCVYAYRAVASDIQLVQV